MFLKFLTAGFDSGAMPFAQHHYPFEDKDLFEQQFPADFISRRLTTKHGLLDSPDFRTRSSYKNVIVLGHVQDETVDKMSKLKGMW